jgi:hypothetical protein
MIEIGSREDDQPVTVPVKGTVDPARISRRGTLALLESSLTPHQAQIEDLVFLRKVLTKAGIASCSSATTEPGRFWPST